MSPSSHRRRLQRRTAQVRRAAASRPARRAACGIIAGVTSPGPAPLAHGPVRGRVAAPGSKSVTTRALLLAALSGGAAVVTGAPAPPAPRLKVPARRRPAVPVEAAG